MCGEDSYRCSGDDVAIQKLSVQKGSSSVEAVTIEERSRREKPLECIPVEACEKAMRRPGQAFSRAESTNGRDRIQVVCSAGILTHRIDIQILLQTVSIG